MAGEFSFSEVEREFSWYTTGRLNIAYEAVDRHVDEGGRAGHKALFFSDGQREESYTFGQLKDYSNKFANVLSKFGVRKGERVAVFMPGSPEFYISFLGILKAGAVVVPMSEAFMEEAVKDRLQGAGVVAVITTPELRTRFDRQKYPFLRHIFVVGGCGELTRGDIQWHNEMTEASREFTPVWVHREDPMFILFASDAYGRPKGIVHVHNAMIGYLYTGRLVHDLKPGDIYWCTGDPGWITGIVYGFLTPWLSGIPIVIKGGRFNAECWYETLAKYKVTVWYSTPTVLRMMMENCESFLRQYNLGSLRHILSVGEPLTGDVLDWSQKYLKQPVYDTWWMSETGMNMICSLKSEQVKPGSIGKPIPGIEAAILDDDGSILPPKHIGNLAIRRGWPAELRGVWNNHEEYYRYFRFGDWFVTGDSAYCDKDGCFYFQGRVDGLINSAGERVGPFEVESKLLEHPAVLAAGVTGKPDTLRGEIIKAYITLSNDYDWTNDLYSEIRTFVKTGLAAHAAPREIEIRKNIPRTKEGKVDRRVLKEWALGLEE